MNLGKSMMKVILDMLFMISPSMILVGNTYTYLYAVILVIREKLYKDRRSIESRK